VSEHLESYESTGNQGTNWHRLCALIVFLLSVVLYSRALTCEFVSWDDPQYVLRNRMVQGGICWSSLERAWTTFECANWHPLTWMSLMLDYQIFGLRPWGFHLTNVLLHGLNSALLYLWLASLARRTGRLSAGQVWFIALVFAVHPVHVESVAWVTERKDVLATCFGLLSLLAHDRWVYLRQVRWSILCTVAFALSLCAKPLFVTLPCVLLLVEYWPMHRWGWNRHFATQDVAASESTLNRSFLYCVVEKWPLFVLSLASCIVTCWAQQDGGSVRTFSQMPFSSRIPNAILNYSSYLQIMSWPVSLCTYYPMGGNQWTDVRVIVAVGVLTLVSLISLCLRHRCPAVLMGWCWFLGTLVPMIGLVQVGSQSIADRYLYLPLIGATLALAAGATVLMDRLRIPTAARRGLVTGVLLVLSGLTWQQIGTWKDTESLARHSLKVVPENWNGHLLLGITHDRAGRADDAIAEYELALKWNPEAGNARNNLAVLLMSQGRISDALEHYRVGLELRPRYGIMRANFANALVRHGKLPEAIAQYELATRELHDNPGLYRNYAIALVSAGRADLAIPVLGRALELAPADPVCMQLLKQARSNSPTS
jgi:Tfp pilus assembly protein PilF